MQAETAPNVVYLEAFRQQRDQKKIENCYEAYLQALDVSDLLHEAKLSVKDIQNGSMSLNNLTKAEKILKELASRMTSLQSQPGQPTTNDFSSLHLEIQNRIQDLQL